MPYQKGQKWKAQVRKDGKQKDKTFNTKKEALAWEAEMRRKPVEEWEEKTDTVCLLDWAEAYLDYSQVKNSKKTYDEKKSMFQRFFKMVDHEQPVSDLTPAQLLNYVVKQSKERSGYAANKDRKNLVAGWNWGMKYFNPVLPGPNPCLVEKMPEVRHPRYIPPEEDFWKVYGAAEGQDQVMLLTFLHLAPRRSEVFRLQWPEDIDFINNRVRLGTRKREDGTFEYAWLPMTKELRKTLRWWWENRPIKDSPYVFLNLNKNHKRQEHYGQPFKYRNDFMPGLCEKAKVKRFGLHGIRHLTASILYNLGYEVAVMQAILRHKSPNTTERYLKTHGIEKVRDALEDLSRKKGEILPFPSKHVKSGKNEDKKEKAVEGAVTSPGSKKVGL